MSFNNTAYTMRKKGHISKGLLIVLSACCALFVAYYFAGPVIASEDKLKKADEYFGKKSYIKAREFYREVFLEGKKGPLSERALFGMGKADYYLQNYYEAWQNIKRFVSSAPDSEHINEANLFLGYTALHLQKFKEAEQYFDMVVEPLKDRASVGKAELALKFWDLKKAENLLAGVGKKTMETDPRALYVRAMINSGKGFHKEAVEIINKIPSSVLTEQDIRAEKAWILFYARKTRDAEMLTKSIIDGPASRVEKLKSKRILLMIYESADKIDDALKLRIELLPYEPGDDSKMKIVALYDKKENVEGALRYLTYVKDKKIKSAEMEKRLKTIMNSGDPKAIEYLSRFSWHIAEDSPFFMDVSRYLIANGKKAEGMGLLRKAARSNPKGEAALYLSELLMAEGRYPEAKKFLEPIMADARYAPRAAPMIAEIMEREGKYNAAIDYLLNIVKTAKDYRPAAKLGDLYYKKGDKSGALKYYVIAADRGDGLSSLKAGDIFYISNDYAKAKLYYKKALDRDIKDPKSLQWVYYQYGKLTKNDEYLKKAVSGGGDVATAASALILERN
ncbi:MAG: hypothetical protein A2077_06505 [Nitrospirae bacterium GWC2_46_6]|nr:MAG: hypothetical protein A2077_06505 [Nitrospirae bacterium GWC2_46_6]